MQSSEQEREDEATEEKPDNQRSSARLCDFGAECGAVLFFGLDGWVSSLPVGVKAQAASLTESQSQ